MQVAIDRNMYLWEYLPLFHHFKAIYQFPKHNIFGQNRS
jgi:hypothetical protein